MNIGGKPLRILVDIRQNSFIASLQQMSCSVPFDIEVGRVGSIGVTNDIRDVSGRRFQEKMIMVSHQAIDMYGCHIAFGGASEIGKKLLSIAIIQENLFLFIAPRGDVFVKSEELTPISRLSWPTRF